MTVMAVVLLITSLLVSVSSDECVTSKTITSGTFASTNICSGELIFADEFDSFDLRKWQHENTLAGGGNWEFQWYTNNRSNSFVENSTLFIKPTLTADEFGETFLYKGVLDINGGSPADFCTNPSQWGCSRTGNSYNILNPVKSARIRTLESFSFKFGRVEIRAKMPTGDWLWPAIWMLPRYNQYGIRWPTSGEIDIVESRGNSNLTLNNSNIGAQRISSTLHWGPDPSQNKYSTTTWSKDNETGFGEEFHKYELLWTPENITFKIDGDDFGAVTLQDGSFWERGDFASLGYANPWKGASNIAPFDKEFYLIINLAVGGINFFPDEAVAPVKKPWSNKSQKAATDFWKAKDDWLPTWDLDGSDNAALQVDYVRVYAL